jgi:hypothetical protein
VAALKPAAGVSLDESHAIEFEAPRRRPEQERRAGQIGADDHTIGARQIERHLAGAAADIDDPRIARYGPVEQAREHAPFSARSERRRLSRGG